VRRASGDPRSLAGGTSSATAHSPADFEGLVDIGLLDTVDAGARRKLN